MKIYITSRFVGDQNRQEIEQLCAAVRSAGLTDFSFVRDIENYQKVFDDPRELWERSKIELAKCDALLIDISDNPSGGRVVEAGMAYALGYPIFVLVRRRLDCKPVYDGIATEVIRYDTYADITRSLQKYGS